MYTRRKGPLRYNQLENVDYNTSRVKEQKIKHDKTNLRKPTHTS